MKQSSKNLFGIKGTNFDIRLEYSEDHMLVHLPKVDKMDKKAFVEMKDLLESWMEFFNLVGYPSLFAVVEPLSPTERLALMLGFTFVAPHEHQNVYKYGE